MGPDAALKAFRRMVHLMGVDPCREGGCFKVLLGGGEEGSRGY